MFQRKHTKSLFHLLWKQASTFSSPQLVRLVNFQTKCPKPNVNAEMVQFQNHNCWCSWRKAICKHDEAICKHDEAICKHDEWKATKIALTQGNTRGLPSASRCTTQDNTQGTMFFLYLRKDTVPKKRWNTTLSYCKSEHALLGEKALSSGPLTTQRNLTNPVEFQPQAIKLFSPTASWIRN